MMKYKKLIKKNLNEVYYNQKMIYEFDKNGKDLIVDERIIKLKQILEL